MLFLARSDRELPGVVGVPLGGSSARPPVSAGVISLPTLPEGAGGTTSHPSFIGNFTTALFVSAEVG